MGGGPVAGAYRARKFLNQSGICTQLRQPHRYGGPNVTSRHANAASFVQPISDRYILTADAAGCVLGRDMLSEPPFVIVVVSAAGSCRRRKRAKYGYAALRPR